MREWRPIIDWEGSYEVSNDGRVRSLDRLDSRGCRRKGKVLKQSKDTHGYPQVSLSKGSKSQTHRVHVLMLEAFVGVRPEGAVGMHLDDDPSHNLLSNLAWGSQSANLRLGVVNRKIPEGEQAPNAKLTKDQVIEMCQDLCAQMTQKDAAEKYGVNQGTVSRIVSGKSWKSVTGPYLKQMQSVRRKTGRRDW